VSGNRAGSRPTTTPSESSFRDTPHLNHVPAEWFLSA
jgi:hypothetical protein